MYQIDTDVELNSGVSSICLSKLGDNWDPAARPCRIVEHCNVHVVREQSEVMILH